ncbi:ABC transporter permease [Caulobacter sp. RHG1]|uniref:cell division protein FtsX n=1 Tax=Caulobacter sp. (strain RHG1) TaxID=2545762 RepID=UPI001552E694|nr:ABC transporter permease [Caulobacter sp. RHG1]NQE62998.1 Cell-division-associated, ABC-transporter-like signaling protein FtsX [Caulobacter sp. RHG1]
MSELFQISRWRPGPLLPPRDARDGALVFVVAVLCFLACLTGFAALAANRAAHGWTAQLTGSATVVVRARAGETPDSAAARAAETLSGVRGVVEAQALTREKAEALLEPWIGKDALVDDLPTPRLVTLELDPKGPPTAETLDKALKAAAVDATVDDHSRWIADIERAANLARLAALGVFALIAAAAAAVIAFATRAGLAARRDVIEVLHFSGAEQSFITALFQNRFATMGALAGLLGGASAAMIGAAVRYFGGGAGVAPVLPLAWIDLAAALPCPLVAALIAGLSARLAASRIVGEMP